jgi:hypothetical protein
LVEILSHARTSALAPAREGRGSLQLEYDRQVDRQSALLRLAERSGRKLEVRKVNGVRIWIVPADLVPTVGCMAAVVR